MKRCASPPVGRDRQHRVCNVQPSAVGARWLRLFWSALRTAVRGYSGHADSQQAAAIAFRVLFSLVPLAALIVAVVDLVIPEVRRDEVVEWVIDMLAGSTGLEESVRRALEQGTTTASFAGLVALAGLIWAASGMMGAIRRAFHAIWASVVPASYVRGKILDFVVVFGAGLVVIVAFGLGIVVDAVFDAGSDLRTALESRVRELAG